MKNNKNHWLTVDGHQSVGRIFCLAYFSAEKTIFMVFLEETVCIYPHYSATEALNSY